MKLRLQTSPISKGTPMLLKTRDLCEYVQLSKPSVYRAIRDNKLPPPHKLTPRTSRWDLSEVQKYLDRNMNK